MSEQALIEALEKHKGRARDALKDAWDKHKSGGSKKRNSPDDVIVTYAPNAFFKANSPSTYSLFG